MNMDNLLAERTKSMRVNIIREILKVVSQPGMVSFAGGIPAPESFPVDLIETLTHMVIEKYGAAAFQYGTTEGFPPLRESLSDYLKKQKGFTAHPDEIFISSGSQGVLDAVGKTLVSTGDRIAVESPTYLGAIQAFDPYEPTYVNIETDDKGMIPESLESVLNDGDLKFIYLVPTFQNPTGRTLPVERRHRIADIIRRFDVLLIEDDPYSDLRYEGNALPPVTSRCPRRNASFMAPGCSRTAPS